MKNLTNLTLLSFLIIVFIAKDIFAIPAFARKYSMSCKTCHSPFPHLKPYGEEFAANGFVLKDKDAPRYFMETGDEKLTLIRDVPLAIRLDGRVTFNENKSKKSDFKSPLALKLLSGGALFKDVSYYIYYILEEGDVGKIEDAFLMFNKIFGSELSFTVGQFQVSDPLFKRELRLTLADYDIFKVRVASSNVDLTYDRGIMLNYGFESGTDLTIEIVNGNGIGSLSNGNFDNDKYKNFVGRISQGIGEHFRIGGFGYLGKEEMSNAINDLWIVGPDLSVSIDPIEFNFQFLERRDKNPYFLASEIEVKTRGAFAELIFRPDGDNSDWYVVGLYNWVESNIGELDKKTGSLHLGYLLARNIRLIGEFTQNFTDNYGRFSIGFVSTF